jgi:hypothetical protein
MGTYIDAPVQSVFEVMKDPATFTELMPGVEFVPEVITTDGVGTTYRFQTRLAGLPIRGSGRFTQVEINRHIRDETSIPIEASFDYWFDAENGGTWVTIEHHAGRFLGLEDSCSGPRRAGEPPGATGDLPRAPGGDGRCVGHGAVTGGDVLDHQGDC